MHSVLENGQHVGQNRFMGKKDACMIEVYHHKGRLSLSLSLQNWLFSPRIMPHVIPILA